MATLDSNKQYISDDTKRMFGDQALIGGQKINYGGSTYDIKDNGNGTRSFSQAGGNMGGGGGGMGGSISNFISSLPSTSSIASRIGSELGIDKIRGTAQSLNNTIFNLPQTYSKATMGHGVNANQLSRIIGQKQSELAPAAALASQNAQAAEANLNTRLGYESADQARAITGYTTDHENELSKYIADMQNGRELSEGEKNRAQQLAIAEMQYKNTQQNMAPIQVSEGNTVIDPTTGRVIYRNNAVTPTANLSKYANILRPPTKQTPTQPSRNFRPVNPNNGTYGPGF